MDKLNLPEQQIEIKISEGKRTVFDPLRKDFVALTPEEWVRQNVIRYLANDLKYPLGLMQSEHGFKVHKRNKRSDILIYDRSGKPYMLVECKAPEVKINRSVFEQILTYATTQKVVYLFVTNGLKHFCCRYNNASGRYEFIENLPRFDELNPLQAGA